MTTKIARDVENILEKTFDALDHAYKSNLEPKQKNANFKSEKSRIVFPIGNDGNRVCEQELRFEFIHQLLKGGDYYYSIETPTVRKYRFSKETRNDFNKYGLTNLDVPRVQTDKDIAYDLDHFGVKNHHPICKSAQFDTVLYDEKGHRVCFIEFKCKDDDYKKEILKFATEGNDVPCFIIKLLENFDDRTYNAISNALSNKLNGVSNIHFILHIVGENHSKDESINKCQTFRYNPDKKILEKW